MEKDRKKDKNAEEVLDELTPESKKKTAGNHENRQLRKIFIGLGIFVVLIIAFVLIGKSLTKFEYKGVKFEIVKEGDLTLYNTKVPLYDSAGGYYSNYNFYLRNDPRKLDVEFNGLIGFNDEMVIRAHDSLNCNGYGIIAIENLRRLYTLYDRSVIRNESYGCDMEGRYTYVNIKPGEETKVEQFGTACYNIEIKDCEILEGTEKFMIETFVKINEQLKG